VSCCTFSVSLSDAADHLQQGKILTALKALASRENLASIGAIAQNAQALARLVKVG
jgi:hypothetical protein